MTKSTRQRLRRRRRAFVKRAKEGVAVFLAPDPGAGGSHGRYESSSDLLYLTGLNEPHVALVLIAGPQRAAHLFLRPHDALDEVWNGPRATVEQGRAVLGVDGVHPLKELDDKLMGWLKNQKVLWVSIGATDAQDKLVERIMKKLRVARGAFYFPAVRDPGNILHELRLIKEAHEVASMQRAAEVTVSAYREAMRAIRPGVNEGEIAALLEHHFRQGGGRGPAYGTIVGTGKNACYLHYHKNDQRMKRGELVLIDAGADVDFYSCDVSRTLPVSGVFTETQARVYDIVLKAQEAAIRQCRPGVPFSRVPKAALKVLVKGLIQLKIIKDRTVRRAIKRKSYQAYYPHGIGHWLGLDTHDVGPYKTPTGKPLKLRPGMVMTIEPGLYFSHKDRRVPKRYRGIGLRIEDDVLITRSGHQILTKKIPKDREAIEAMMYDGVTRRSRSAG